MLDAHTNVSKKYCKLGMDAFDGPSLSDAASKELCPPTLSDQNSLLADMALTDGQPVSAMYIVGLLDRAAAGCTFCSWKNSYVHEAASLIDTLANQGCTLDI